MKKLATAAVAMMVWAGAAFADPLEGQWRTSADDNGNSGLIEVAMCGEALCGTLIKSFDAAGAEMDSENIGKLIISETVMTADGEYRGKVYSPDRDKTYNSRLKLTGDTLAVSGCVFGICRDGGVWTRT